MKKILTCCAALLLAGCQSVAPSVVTQSGKPEVTIAASTDAIKAAILGQMVNVGYTVTKDTPYSIELTRPTNGAEDMVSALTIGNAYSSNHRITSFIFVPQPDGTVRVIASATLESQLPGGQVNSVDVSGGRTFNVIEAMLEGVKNQLEAAKPQPAPAPPASANAAGDGERRPS